MNQSKAALENTAQWDKWLASGAVASRARIDAEKLLAEGVAIDSMIEDCVGRNSIVGLGMVEHNKNFASPAVIVRVPTLAGLRKGQVVRKEDMPKGMVALKTNLPK